MKKYKVLVALACVVLLVVGSMAPALAAKGDKAKGAVKAVVVDSVDPSLVVGFAIANTNDSGQLKVMVHLHKAAGSKAFSAEVGVVELGIWTTGPLNTNAQGNGNCQVVVDISSLLTPVPPANVTVRVVLKGDGGELYWTGSPGDFMIVPVK